jgi:hypothetical protein
VLTKTHRDDAAILTATGRSAGGKRRWAFCSKTTFLTASGLGRSHTFPMADLTSESSLPSLRLSVAATLTPITPRGLENARSYFFSFLPPGQNKGCALDRRRSRYAKARRPCAGICRTQMLSPSGQPGSLTEIELANEIVFPQLLRRSAFEGD